MTLASDVGRAYTFPARLMHWTTVLMVVISIPVGIVMGRIEGGALQNALYDLHRSLGFLVLVVTLVRLVYRLFFPPPPLPAELPSWQPVVSKIVHIALYTLLIVVPIVGWAGTSAFGAPIWIFGLFVLPDFVAQDRVLARQLLDLHEVLSYTLAGLIVIHIGAAFYHLSERGDRVFRRML